MKTVLRKLMWAVALTALVMNFTACGAKSPTAPDPPGLSVAPMAVSIPYTGGTKQLAVTGEGAWSVSLTSPWVSASPMSGTGTGTVTVTAQFNGGSARTTTVTVGGKSVSVSQDPVMAPPPPGVSAALWRIGFSNGDAKLRGLPEAVHFVLPEGTDQATRDLIAGYVNDLNSWGLTTRFDFNAGAPGVTVPISISIGTEGAACGIYGNVAACTTLQYDATGRLVKASTEFASVRVMKDRAVFFHEAFRCLGVEGLSPETGIMNRAASGSRPTDAELAMLLGRQKYPLLTVYTPE